MLLAWAMLPLGCGGPSATDAPESKQGAALGALGDPLPGLTANELASFAAGRAEFMAAETVADGLGPVFNGNACVACHSHPQVGGVGSLRDTRVGTLTDAGAFDALARFGGSLLQKQGIGPINGCDVLGELIPAQATIVADRRPTPLFGLGLIEATPDATLVALADAQAGDPDGVSGRVNLVTNVVDGSLAVGRFGWKAATPNLVHQAAAAYSNEMGITTPFFPSDPCPQGVCAQQACDAVPGIEDAGDGVQAFASFMRLLGPPPSTKLTGLAQAGSNSFAHLGCATCHVPSLTTGASPVAALDHVTYAPYSDFLLHDMGALGDGIVQGQATGQEMRTAPLWGVSQQLFFLHDGRAATLTEAILAHDGEARAARDRFAALSAQNQQKIIAFLDAL